LQCSTSLQLTVHPRPSLNCARRTSKVVSIFPNDPRTFAPLGEDLSPSLGEDLSPSQNACRRAAIAVSNGSPEAAEDWLDEHIDDDDIDEPIEGEADAAIVAYLRTLEYEAEDEDEQDVNAPPAEVVAAAIAATSAPPPAPPAPSVSVPQAVLPENAVVFDAERHAAYDYAAEEATVEAVVQQVASLKRFGVDKEDAAVVPKLQLACEALAIATAQSPAPAVRDDTRVLGDWELIGTTSTDVIDRAGLTGLGKAPFTEPIAIFYSFMPSGEVLAKEVLSFFGNPVLLNELRGRFGFDSGGTWMQEKYEQADLSGQRNSAQFVSATATSKGVCISADGALRLASTNGRFFVFKKLADGELAAWLESKRLPVVGGTVASLDPDEMAIAYPYLGKEGSSKKKDGGGGGGFGWPFG